MIVAALGLQNYIQHTILKTEIRTQRDQLHVDTATAEWTSRGLKVVVVTTQGAAETDTEFARRHRRRVDAMLVEFPKDP